MPKIPRTDHVGAQVVPESRVRCVNANSPYGHPTSCNCRCAKAPEPVEPPVLDTDGLPITESRWADI